MLEIMVLSLCGRPDPPGRLILTGAAGPAKGAGREDVSGHTFIIGGGNPAHVEDA
jgi:hypothetical protein